MRKYKQHGIFSLFILSICLGMTMTADSPCGDWEQYKDEKCVKIIDEAKTHDDAVKTCQQQENSSILISVHSMEEQEFFSNLLFKTHKVVDTVWIGAKYVSNKFKWADDTEVRFTNWAEGSPSNTADKACVQMIPDGSSMGKWVDEPCNKKNLVVCQKMQTWSLSRLQQTLLDARMELRDSIEDIRKNPVPIGFIYVQLPSQPEPKTLWPMVLWKDVTSDYAGLFFRAEGGGAAAFETLQNANIPLRYIDRVIQQYNDQPIHDLDLTKIGWSEVIVSGGQGKCCETLKFHVSEIGGEVRPINKSVRIWKRTN